MSRLVISAADRNTVLAACAGLAVLATSVSPAAASTPPAYHISNHFAMQAASPEELRQWREWLVEHDVEVLGPINHGGQALSIYFHDPNGIRLEIATPLDPDWNRHTEKGQADLAAWIEAKERAQRDAMWRAP